MHEIIEIGEADISAIHLDLYIYLKNLAHLNNTAQAIERYIERVVHEDGYPQKRREIPFSSQRKWAAIELPESTLLLGAPERLLRPSDPHFAHAQAMARDGMRVLAFARMSGVPQDGAIDVADVVQSLALIIMSDQIRDDIQDTLQAFRDEGLKLKVISGDNLETVRAIARDSGMSVEKTTTGAELDAMGESEFDRAVSESQVFARIDPDTKQRIVEALRRQGEYVSMVGDGVNDVPALKAANLAIVMNDGTQISKDVADIVLLNNAMSTLPRAFREGKETNTDHLRHNENVPGDAIFTISHFLFSSPLWRCRFRSRRCRSAGRPSARSTCRRLSSAFGWLRPQFIARFRRDVMDYIFTMGFIGAVIMTLLYLITWFSSDGDLMLTRSNITIMVALYGMLITWHIQGINLYQPRSFLQHWRLLLLSSVLNRADHPHHVCLSSALRVQAAGLGWRRRLAADRGDRGLVLVDDGAAQPRDEVSLPAQSLLGFDVSRSGAGR